MALRVSNRSARARALAAYCASARRDDSSASALDASDCAMPASGLCIVTSVWPEDTRSPGRTETVRMRPRAGAPRRAVRSSFGETSPGTTALTDVDPIVTAPHFTPPCWIWADVNVTDVASADFAPSSVPDGDGPLPVSLGLGLPDMPGMSAMVCAVSFFAVCAFCLSEFAHAAET